LRDERQKADETEVADWLKRCLADGDARYWGRIFEKYKRPIFVQCHRMLRNEADAEDLTSDVFLKAFENLRTYDMTRPFYPWLYRIAANLCIDHIRRKSRIRFTQTDDWENVKADEDATCAERKDVPDGRLEKAIDKLKRPQKECFNLFYIHQKSYDEIVRLTGFTYDEVRSHLQNGRRKFKLLMEQGT
jgi:RNA polymerase sigma factor (sigma-70 family)